MDRTFDARTTLDGDFELIPIPGHTPARPRSCGKRRHRMLFTGDSLYLARRRVDRGRARVLSDREAYLDSLRLIAELDFDVLVPWAASADGPWYADTTGRHARGSTRSSNASRAARALRKHHKGSRPFMLRQGGGIAGWSGAG